MRPIYLHARYSRFSNAIDSTKLSRHTLWTLSNHILDCKLCAFRWKYTYDADSAFFTLPIEIILSWICQATSVYREHATSAPQATPKNYNWKPVCACGVVNTINNLNDDRRHYSFFLYSHFRPPPGISIRCNCHNLSRKINLNNLLM